MGCDIHMYVERRNEDGVWEATKGKNPRIANYRKWADGSNDPKYAVEMRARADQIESGNEGTDDYDAPEVYKDWAWDGRNYDLFAILANVRNGYGFAGVKTGSGFIPILQALGILTYDDDTYIRRGIPINVSEFVQTAFYEWGEDGHTPTWLTIQELVDYPLWTTGLTVKTGWVNQAEYETFLKNGKPNGWSGGVSGGRVRHISNEEMSRLIEGKTMKEADASYYTQVEWVESYADRVGDFYTETIPALKALAGDDLTSVRIVFWFDN